MSVFNDPMRSTLLKKTADLPEFVGHALAVYRTTEGITAEEQAQMLGIDLDGLVRLALCRVPRRRHYQKDLAAICNHVGAREEVLLGILRSLS